MNPTVIPRAQWLKQGESLFGTRDPKSWRYLCPSCGHVQTWTAWKVIGHEAPERVLGYSCIGSVRGGPGVVAVGEPDKGAGCLFAGNLDELGLIPLFVQAGVTVKDGAELPVGDFIFNFSPPRKRA